MGNISIFLIFENEVCSKKFTVISKKSAKEITKSEFWHLLSSKVKGNIIRETMDDPIMPKIKSKCPTKIPTKNGKNRKVINHFVDKTKFFQFFDASNDQINKLLEFYGIDADPELFFR